MLIYVLVEKNLLDGTRIFRECFTERELRTWLDENGYCRKQWVVYDIDGFEVGILIEFEKSG